MSRLENTGKNAAFSTAANLLYTLMGVLGQYVFLRVLDETYLGISSLFYSIIGVLSFVNLGFNSAFSFCFYKPIIENDIPHIQAILKAFKRLMRGIAGFILVAGLAVIPFLRMLIKGGENISYSMLVVYYLVDLANTILPYFLVYKICYITACQKAYKLVSFNAAANVATIFMQIMVLLVFRSYVLWVLCRPLVTVVQYTVMNRYIKREFPETNFTHAESLPEEDKKSIYQNIKAAALHRFGSICISQTDSIIVSSMVSISTTGLLSNYVLIKNAVLSVLDIVQGAVVPGVGHLLASENEKVQKNVLYTYMMMNYLMVGFAVCGIGILSSPFITLVFGAAKTVDELTVTLMCIGFYFTYQTHALHAFPTAAGQLMLGAWSSVLEGITNLVVSILAVKYMGLPGVFVGTVFSQFLNYVIRPFPVFRGIYREKPYKYFRHTLLYFISTMLSYSILWALRTQLFASGVTIVNFALLTLATPVVFFGTAWILWGRTQYGREAIGVIRQALRLFLKRK